MQHSHIIHDVVEKNRKEGERRVHTRESGINLNSQDVCDVCICCGHIKLA